MLQIKSYIMMPNKKFSSLNELEKNPDEYFIEINDLDKLEIIKTELNFDYLDGAIILIYNNETILSYRHWDIVDDLWSYIINLIDDLEENGESRTGFPDQAIEIFLKKTPENKILFSLIIKQQVQKWIIPKSEFYNAIFTHARDFFKKLMFIFPENIHDYKEELNRIDFVEKKTIESKN